MDEQIRDFLGEDQSGRVARGEFLKWAAILGIGTPFVGAGVAHAARSGARVAAPAKGGTIKVGATTAVSIDPPQLIDGPGIGIAQQSGEYLVKVGSDLVVRPWLATSWKPSQGGAVWTISLRKGVTFHS